jgi:hypothetical protein
MTRIKHVCKAVIPFAQWWFRASLYVFMFGFVVEGHISEHAVNIEDVGYPPFWDLCPTMSDRHMIIKVCTTRNSVITL